MRSNDAIETVPNSSDKQATVFIVEDDPLVRRSISFLVRSVGLEAATYELAQSFINKYEADSPGCLVLDVRLPGMTGLELQQKLARLNIEIPIIFITAYAEIPLATAALRAGAVDFLCKPFSPQALLERIHEAISIDRKRRDVKAKQREISYRVSTLTEREREVMPYLANGDETKVIAKRLGISPKTVDNHRTKILEKMGVQNTAQLARQFVEQTLVSNSN